MKTKPTIYCHRICHKIGYYLQQVHGLDLVRMRVDFQRDEFGKIHLFGVDELLIRQGRFVPRKDDNNMMLADFIMKEISIVNTMEKKQQTQQLSSQQQNPASILQSDSRKKHERL